MQASLCTGPEGPTAMLIRGRGRALVSVSLLAGILALGLACIIEDLKLEGRKCSDNRGCGGGTVCDVTRGVCVRGTDGRSEGLVDATQTEPRVGDLPQGSEPRQPDRPSDRPLAPESPLKPDQGPCSPACPAPKICCKVALADGGGSFQCADNASQCVCNPSTGDPCGGSFPVCCSQGGGDPRCQPNASGCLCNESTGNPCFGAYPRCCRKGTDPLPHCYADGTSCISN